MALLPTSADIQYMKGHIEESRVVGIIAVNVSGLCIAVAAVCLRVISRRLVRAKIKADDWMIAVALVLFSGFAVSYCVATHFGAGRHAILVTNPKALTETYIIIESFYVWTLTTIKMSILFLYHRIFPQKWFRHSLIATGSILIIWGLAGLFVQIFQCWPIKQQWDPSAGGRCISYATYALTLVITNIVTDLCILALPISPVWRLQTSTKNKWMLTVTFAMGCGACIVSIVRLVYVHDLAISYDSSWKLTRSGEIATSELMVGIVAACVPTYRPIYKSFVKAFQSRLTKGSHSSAYGPSGATLGKEQLHAIELMNRSPSDRAKEWISLEEDEEKLVRTNVRDVLQFSGTK